MNKITIIRGCITSAFRPAMRMSWWLLKIMLPISLAVRLLQYYGVIAWCAQWLDPVFQYLGLPGASAIAFLTTIMTRLFGRDAVDDPHTEAGATIIAISGLICHVVLALECAVVKRVGSKAV